MPPQTQSPQKPTFTGDLDEWLRLQDQQQQQTPQQAAPPPRVPMAVTAPVPMTVTAPRQAPGSFTGDLDQWLQQQQQQTTPTVPSDQTGLPTVPTGAGMQPPLPSLQQALPAVASTLYQTGKGIVTSPTTMGAIAGELAIPGPVGPVVGAMTGRTLEDIAKARAKAKGLEATLPATAQGPPPASSLGWAADIGWQGLQQGIYSRIARGVGAVTGRLLAPEVPTPGTTIAGVNIPESLGQAEGRPFGVLQKMEHWLTGTPMGQPLRDLIDEQQGAFRQILAKLSGVTDADAGTVAANWAKARETTKLIASPMYKAIENRPATGVADVARDLLAKNGGDMNPATVTALKTLTGEASREAPEVQAAAKNIYRQLYAGAVPEGPIDIGAAMQNPSFRSAFEADLEARGLRWRPGGAPLDVGDALRARYLLDKAATSKDTYQASLAADARKAINNAIDQSLTNPADVAVKQRADQLWKRSYIMDEIADHFGTMQQGQTLSKPPTVFANSFTRMMRDLTETQYAREGGKVIQRPSKLDALFDNPVDKQAMLELEKWMSTKGQTLGGATNMMEQMASLGATRQTFELPAKAAGVALMMQKPGPVLSTGIYLRGMALAAHIMAEPGGPKLLLDYFRGDPGTAAAISGRIANRLYGAATTPSTVPRPNAPPRSAIPGMLNLPLPAQKPIPAPAALPAGAPTPLPGTGPPPLVPPSPGLIGTALEYLRRFGIQ